MKRGWYRRNLVGALGVFLTATSGLLAACGNQDSDKTHAATPERTTVTVTSTQDVPASYEPIFGDDAESTYAADIAAKQTEDEFLELLDEYRIPYETRDLGVANGILICELLDSGETDSSVVEMMELSAGITSGEASVLVGISVQEFCPEHG